MEIGKKTGGGNMLQDYSKEDVRYCDEATAYDRFLKKVVSIRLLKINSMIEKAKSLGCKINKDELIFIIERNNKFFWLEQGNEKSGLNHIISKHGKEFESNGIEISEIPRLIRRCLIDNKIIAYQRCNKTRPIYSTKYKEKEYFLAITVSNKGFVVGANVRTKILNKERINENY